jgi:Phasin protein
MERDKEKTESEFKSSEPETIWPRRSEGERQAVEHSQAELAKQSQQADVKAQAGQKSGGKRVADNREGAFDSFTKISESVFSLEGMKKAAAWYIETSEKLANQALELQEKATGWAKDTPFASLFEAQHSIARKFVERSANAARTLWQIPSDQ